MTQMLSNDPEKRPTAMEIFSSLRGMVIVADPAPHEGFRDEFAPVYDDVVGRPLVIEGSTTSSDPFFRPGDL